MDSTETSTIRVLVTHTDSNGGRLELVAYDDSGCGLRRDGRPIPDMKWDAEQMEQCAVEFLRLGELGGKGVKHHATV